MTTITCGACGVEFVFQRMPKRLRLVGAAFTEDGDGGSFVHPIGTGCTLDPSARPAPITRPSEPVHESDSDDSTGGAP